MADYISREAFIKSVLQETSSESIEELIDYVETQNLHLDWAGGMLKAIQLAAELPAADVWPVVKSRWVEIDDYVLCANCGTAEHSPNRNFCHNCGCAMGNEK